MRIDYTNSFINDDNDSTVFNYSYHVTNTNTSSTYFYPYPTVNNYGWSNAFSNWEPHIPLEFNRDFINDNCLNYIIDKILVRMLYEMPDNVEPYQYICDQIDIAIRIGLKQFSNEIKTTYKEDEKLIQYAINKIMDERIDELFEIYEKEVY